MVEKIGKAYWDIVSIQQIKEPKEAIKEFEAYLFRIFLKEARKSIPEGLFSSFSSKFYYDLLDMEMAEVASQTDPLKFEILFEKAIASYSQFSKESK
ncbi:flagellar biosynthesis protein FlgJ [Phorcysia thermohydrogeniphila]|uniref:Flagellar protein FlgJ n=1 Tax=Phorcysia thermohydrogeniphila TaxID=936138 RepID=A0A4R1GI57_9BACT|nr:flagellar biosynthesis protein FlgJ [Phorcysia thermohydrogeniphila]TCK03892.1 flagellar protein FlgJ [Phorcysia thermohydrogeniphila]